MKNDCTAYFFFHGVLLFALVTNAICIPRKSTHEMTFPNYLTIHKSLHFMNQDPTKTFFSLSVEIKIVSLEIIRNINQSHTINLGLPNCIGHAPQSGQNVKDILLFWVGFPRE